MPKSPRGGSRQPELFPRSKRPTVPIDENHRLVQLADRLDWTEMEVRAEEIRASKLKNAAGRPPRLRALLGAMVLRATRYMPLSSPGAGGPDTSLRASSVPVRADGDGLDPGPQHAARLHGVDGRGRTPLHQRVRGGVGGGGEAGGPEGAGGGHDGAGVRDAVPERDGSDGRLHCLAGGGLQRRRRGIQALGRAGEGGLRGGEEEGAGVPALRQDEGAEGQGDGRDGEHHRRRAAEVGPHHREGALGRRSRAD